MRNSKKYRITRNLNFISSFLLLSFLLFSIIPGELESQSNTINIQSNVRWFPNKPTGKMYTITDNLGTTINEIARNETAYLVGTIFTGTPIYPEPLEIWGYIAKAGIPIDQGYVFGKAQTDPDNNHRFVIPLHNGTKESLTIYQSLKGSYQVSAYVPDYTQVPDNFIIEPPGSWGTPDTLDILAYSEINVLINGETIHDATYPVVRGQKLTVKLEARYDDFSWIDASKTAVELTLQTAFNSEGSIKMTKAVQESTPDHDFEVGVPFDQPAGVYWFYATLDHTSLSNKEEPYLKGSTTGWITHRVFRVEVEDTQERYSKVDVTGPFVVNPGRTIYLRAYALYLDNNFPFSSTEGLEFIFNGPFNITKDDDFETSRTIYSPDHSYLFKLVVHPNQDVDVYEFQIVLNHEDHTNTINRDLRGGETFYTSERTFDIRVTNDPLIIISNPDRSRYISRDQPISVSGFIDPSKSGVPLTVRIGSKDHLTTYLKENINTDPYGEFSVTFADLIDLQRIPSGEKSHIWVTSDGYSSDYRELIVVSGTTIKIESFDPDPWTSGQTYHVYGSLKDNQNEGIDQEAISISVQVEGKGSTVSGNTFSNGNFDIPLTIGGVDKQTTIWIQAKYNGRLPYYQRSESEVEVIIVNPPRPPEYIIDLNITDVQPPPEVVIRLRNESILVQGHFKNDSDQGINPLPNMDIEVYLGTQDQNTIYIREATTTDELGDFVVHLWLNGSIPVGDLLIWADAPESGLDPTSETEIVRIWSLSEINEMMVQPLEFDRAFSGGEIQVNGTLIDDQGQPIKFAVVSFNWNGETPVAESSTNANGQFSTILLVPTVPEATTRTLFANYESTDFYEASLAESPIDITPNGPTFLDITVDRTTVYMGENITVTGTLTDQYGDRIPAGQTITITWDGYLESGSTSTDLNSAFSTTTSAPIVDSTGSYILHTSFAQITGYQDANANTTVHIFVDTKYNDLRLIAAVSNETVKQKINLARVTGVTYEPNVNITVQGTLLDDFDNPIKNRRLQVVLVNNVTGTTVTQLNVTSDQKGQFSAMIRPCPSPGTYRFELHFTTETGDDFPTNTPTFTILNPPGPDLFMFALVDGFGVFGGVIIAYFLHRRGVILSGE